MAILITITADNEFVFQGKVAPIVGRNYWIEDAEKGTEAQSKLLHLLIQIYFTSGLYTYKANSVEDLKRALKRHLGEGFELITFIDIEDDEPVLREVQHESDIPDRVKSDPMMSKRIRGFLKSFRDYTKIQRRRFIDAVISQMIQSGVRGPRFDEIIQKIDYTFGRN